MAKSKTIFYCTDCGNEFPKWQGRCPSCGAWNTVEEYVEKPIAAGKVKAGHTGAIRPAQKLCELSGSDEIRFSTGMGELDRVLGGGAVAGSLVLVGGAPGIGKSTLLLQICNSLCADKTVLYVSGEESERQIKMRATRLGVAPERLFVLSETRLSDILESVEATKPDILIVDSIQTLYNENNDSLPGSVSQVKDCTMTMMQLSKTDGITVFVVGHINKDGNIAGPKVLEHMVDCVLYFEGDPNTSYRLLRAAKNRFGSTNEIGVFEMKDSGLMEVQNPSAMMLSGRPENATGSAIVCTIEGSRPMLAEIQALSSQTGFAIARRMSTGIDHNRATMLVAILEKRLGYSMQNQDVYINVVGGLRIVETASDLAVITAIASNYKNFVIDGKTLVLGEVGLTGEIRSISFAERRISEAKKMGFERCIIPKDNAKELEHIKDIEIIPVQTVKDTIKILNKEKRLYNKCWGSEIEPTKK